MKRLLLGLLLSAALAGAANAQCVGAGNININVLPGMNCLSEPTAATYGATGVGIVPAAAATDIACLTGSATRTTRLQSIRVSGSGTAISVPVLITKHIVANTGGTATTGTAIPVPFRFDTASAAPTATTVAWTANPTVTAGAGILDNGNLGVVATTVGAAVQPYLFFDYSSRNYSQAIVLRGVAQEVCVNLNGTSPTALLNVTFRWTELAQ